MAKKRASTAKPAADVESQYKRAATEAAIEKIKDTYRAGVKLNKQHGPLHSQPTGVLVETAAKQGRKRNSIERQRHFARDFTQDEIDKICALCLEHQHPLGVTLIMRTLSIHDPVERMKLLKKAILYRWSKADLFPVVRKQTGATARPGRPRKLPADRDDACHQIVRRLTPELEWLKGVSLSAGLELQKPLKERIDATIECLQGLIKAAGKSV